jgi:hypothetical protein
MGTQRGRSGVHILSIINAPLGGQIGTTLAPQRPTPWLGMSDSNFDVQGEYHLFEMSPKFGIAWTGADRCALPGK